MLPHSITGNPSNPILVLIAGFPDDEISGWAPVINLLQKDFYVISVCFPGNEKNGKPKSWGYDINEVVDMLEITLNSINKSTQKYTLITHDWGAIIGYIYENRYPNKVIKMIALDIGLNVEPRFRIFLYQTWYAICYIISQLFGRFIASIPFFTLLILFKIFPFLSPLGMDGDTPRRKISELHPEMCYPYYYLWKYLIENHFFKLLTLGDIPVFWKMPSCPLLFMYGKRKNVMFHGKKFLEDIKKKSLNDSLSRYVELNSGHWMMYQQLDTLVFEINSFILESNYEKK